MPDFSGSLNVGAATPEARTAVLGAAAPIVARPLSVHLAPMPLGASAPMHAQGAGLPLLGSTPTAVAVVAPLFGDFDPPDVISQNNQQHFGGRPSGFGEAFKVVYQRYKSGESTPTTDAAQILNEALKRSQGVITEINDTAESVGLPTLKDTNEKLLRMTEEEGQLVGNEASGAGMVAVTESTPAWLADP